MQQITQAHPAELSLLVRPHTHRNADIQRILQRAYDCGHIPACGISSLAQHSVKAFAADMSAAGQFSKSDREINQIPEKHAREFFIDIIFALIVQFQCFLENFDWLKGIETGEIRCQFTWLARPDTFIFHDSILLRLSFRAGYFARDGFPSSKTIGGWPITGKLSISQNHRTSQYDWTAINGQLGIAQVFTVCKESPRQTDSNGSQESVFAVGTQSSHGAPGLAQCWGWKRPRANQTGNAATAFHHWNGDHRALLMACADSNGYARVNRYCVCYAVSG